MPTSSTARQLMSGFAFRTGLTAPGPVPRRYLWTDAFAVCNFLGIFTEDGDGNALELALRLVDQVHHVLGRHRPDDPRRGWISGLDEAEGEAHPTVGGLRIGKKLAERQPDERYDDALEWERDGQYFHYLTRWMHALDRVARVTGDATYRRWAIELARTAYARFTYRASSDGPRQMYWKMSIDLSRPQVASMGHHDPLDGFITLRQLQAGAGTDPGLDLHPELAGLSRMCSGRSWLTDDPLGIGGLLSDACKLAQLGRLADEPGAAELELLESVLWSAARGLESFVTVHDPGRGAGRRLGFRELGLSIGLHAVGKTAAALDRVPVPGANRHRLDTLLGALARYETLALEIERFWLDPSSRQADTWAAHQDINDVMLATSLAPTGYLLLDGGPDAESEAPSGTAH